MVVLNILCPVCNDGLKDANDVYSTSCGHLYHFGCMNEWRRKGTSCPRCQYYNPTVHKLYLSSEGSGEDVGKQAEMELKLKISNEKVTKLLVDISDSETNFLNVQKEFTTIENAKRIVEQRIKQLNDSEGEFMSLQGQYTEASQLVKDLKKRLHQLCMENELKLKRLQLKRQENESLRSSLETGDNYLSDGIIPEKVKAMDLKIKIFTEELQKVISANMQLKIEKIKLQSCLNHLNKENDKKPITNDPGNKTKEVARRNSSSSFIDDNNNCVFIKGLPLEEITIPLSNVILNLGAKMDLSISEDDLISVNFVDNKQEESCSAQLRAQFKTRKLKEDFISMKFKLKTNPTLKFIVIAELLNNDVFDLFKYAKEKLRYSGFNCIFSKGNKIFAKRNRLQRNAVLIENKNQVDIMYKIHQESVIGKVKKFDGVDENFYQL